MTLPRRSLLQLLGAAGATLLAPGLHAGSDRRVERVGLQLYTVRSLMAEGVAATLDAVAAAGYVEVETAGTGDLDAPGFARAVRDAGLTAPAAHVPLELMREQPDELLSAAEIIGYRFLVAPWLAPELRTVSGYGQAIDTLNVFGERCARAGVQLCYHNHDFEFQPLGGELPFDRMLRECDRELVRFELDLFWAAHAGVDAGAYLRADPARFPLCHVKDRNAAGEMVDVGEGSIDFPALFAAGTGFEHYFVEHDRPADPLASVRRSIEALRKMRF